MMFPRDWPGLWCETMHGLGGNGDIDVSVELKSVTMDVIITGRGSLAVGVLGLWARQLAAHHRTLIDGPADAALAHQSLPFASCLLNGAV